MAAVWLKTVLDQSVFGIIYSSTHMSTLFGTTLARNVTELSTSHNIGHNIRVGNTYIILEIPVLVNIAQLTS